MAYAGGYAGGYADTLVPPAPTDQGIGYQHPIYRRPPGKSVRIRSRYRLTIIGNGSITHTTRQPITVITGGDRSHQHRCEVIAAVRVERTVEVEHASRTVYRADPQAGGGTILDPDEWLVFL